ncbi:UDP-glucose 4-epimerase GalE [Aureimonas jatrophae]|uniref:UDP-glucose 4-epimerase n=1 Tax=Aureimonas jatrophae TaxID=1166073 RepID=A0A1H0EXZ2_9HYPH|nr:UDP-glucose 4-epimerase GalE [Aureimonas jatrophae]MBB3950264.1 UDP-glucose 4-epimerase [Aureimonas jatrophae]SDN87242.1 UDP-galactose 4-epimerase [Aureimonas jatrophae]
MTVLVTGGAGYIGSHMVWELLDAGEEVVVLDRLSSGFEWAVAPEATLVVGDVGDGELAARVIAEHGVTEIIHFAGSIVVPESVADPLGYYLNNTVASRALIESAVRGGVKHFIFSSTAAVYGSPKSMPVTEDQPPAPESPYGTSKWMTELMLRDTAAAHPLTFAALRYFNVAGADPKGRTGQSTKGATHLVKVASETALGKRPYLEVFGTDYDTPDGTCVRDYIHVSDLAKAHAKALGYLRAGGPSIVANCGYGHGYSVLEVLETVRRVVGADFEVRRSGRRAGDATAIVADATTARTRFGWEPEHDDLEEIVGHALAWERSLATRNAR